MVTIRENTVVITQKNMVKKSNHTDTKIFQNRKKLKGFKKEKGKMDLKDNQKTVNKMVIVSPYLSIIKCKLIKIPKGHRVAEWMKKKNPTICCL